MELLFLKFLNHKFQQFLLSVQWKCVKKWHCNEILQYYFWENVQKLFSVDFIQHGWDLPSCSTISVGQFCLYTV